MMRYTRRFRFRFALPMMAVAILSLGMFTTPVSAGFQVTAQFTGVSPGQNVTILSGSFAANTKAGIFNFTDVSGYINKDFQGFCIDIGQAISVGQITTFDVRNLWEAPVPGAGMGVAKADLIAELWANQFTNIGTNDQRAAAFQVSVWEIINETNSSLSVTGGQFQVTAASSGTRELANQWLQDLSLDNPTASKLIALTSGVRQDYVVQTMPEPGSLTLLGMGSASLFCLFWRRRKTQLVAA